MKRNFTHDKFEKERRDMFRRRYPRGAYVRVIDGPVLKVSHVRMTPLKRLVYDERVELIGADRDGTVHTVPIENIECRLLSVYDGQGLGRKLVPDQSVPLVASR